MSPTTTRARSRWSRRVFSARSAGCARRYRPPRSAGAAPRLVAVDLTCNSTTNAVERASREAAARSAEIEARRREERDKAAAKLEIEENRAKRGAAEQARRQAESLLKARKGEVEVQERRLAELREQLVAARNDIDQQTREQRKQAAEERRLAAERAKLAAQEQAQQEAALERARKAEQKALSDAQKKAQREAAKAEKLAASRAKVQARVQAREKGAEAASSSFLELEETKRALADKEAENEKLRTRTTEQERITRELIDRLTDGTAEQQAEASARIQQEEEKKECVVCLTNERSHLLSPCGHYVLCAACVLTMNFNGGAKSVCPVCQQRVNKVVKVFDP